MCRDTTESGHSFMGHEDNSFYCFMYSGGHFGVCRAGVGTALGTVSVLCRKWRSLLCTSGAGTKWGAEDRIDMAATGSVLCCLKVSVYTAPTRANGASL